jgi:hypothetical protein
MNQEYDQGQKISDLCDVLDSVVIQCEKDHPVILSAVCLLLSRWLQRAAGGKEAAIDSFRQNGIPHVEAAIHMVEAGSTTMH